MATGQLAPQPAAVTDVDRMPVHGIDHLELYVGNAAQAAFFFTRAFGFTETAYSGLETGRRDRVSHVLEQGRIRLVVTGTLAGDDEIGEHHKRHGDGVHKVALSVPDAEAAYWQAVEHGARGVMTPHWAEDEHGRVGLSSVATYGDTVHLFVQRDGFDGPFLPGFTARDGAPAGTPLLAGIDHVVGNVELGHMEEWVALRARVRHDRAHPLLGRRDLHRVLGPDVEGRHRRERAAQVPDQRAGGGQAQVADRGVPRLLQGRRRTARGAVHARHRRSRRGAPAARRGLPADPRVLLRRGTRPDREIEQDLADLRRLGILVDRDDEGYLLQIFTKPLGDRPTLFFELIERHGSRGFGEGNFKALFQALEREQERRGNL